MVFILHNEHFYLLSDDQTKSLCESNKDRKDKNILSSNLFREFEIENTFNLPIHENILIDDFDKYTDCNIIYSTHNLYDMLIDLYNKQNHQVGTHNIKCDSQKHVTYFYYKPNNLHIYADINYDLNLNTNWQTMKALCDKVNIKFNNQTITSVVTELEKRFYKLKSERVELTKEQKDDLLKECDNKCEQCNKELKKKSYQFDHIEPLASGGLNEIENIQVLCVECHHEKTRLEQENSDYIFVNKSESSFNQQVKDVYMSPDAKPYAFIENINVNVPKTHNKLIHIDINKTRRNMLIHNKLKLTAHCVMDQIEEFTENDKQIVAGIYYVETFCYLPIRGNGWYCHNTIKHLLDTGKINLRNIKYKLVSTLKLDADYFKEFFNYIIANFTETYQKLGPNAFVGLFNKRCNTRSKLHMTTSYKQAVSQFFECEQKFVSHDRNVNLYCIFEDHKVEYDETRMPLYKYVVEQEAIEMDILKTHIENSGGVIVRYNTDCISAYFKSDKQIKDVVENTYWDDAKTIKKYKFELKEKENFDKFHEKMPKYMRHEKLSFDLSRNWDIKNDDDDFVKLANELITSKKSFLINGRAGCGKSTLLKQIMSQLDDSYIALAPTNKACRIIDGQTIHKFLAGSFNNKKSLMRKLEDINYIIIDEISMVKEIFYKVFLSIKRLKPNIKFILCGDFKQLK